MIDEAFYFGNRWACWVDLERGIIMCDMASPDLACHFAPLPEEYQVTNRGRPDVFSTVGVVNGEIKLLFMEGFDDRRVPRDQVKVNNFSLSMTRDLVRGKFEWVRDEETSFRVGDLWTVESFLAIPGLPKIAPMCPVLWSKEPNTAYFFMSDIGIVDGTLGTTGEYVLILDMGAKKVNLWSKCPPGRSAMLHPSYIATEFRGCSAEICNRRLGRKITSHLRIY